MLAACYCIPVLYNNPQSAQRNTASDKAYSRDCICACCKSWYAATSDRAITSPTQRNAVHMTRSNGNSTHSVNCPSSINCEGTGRGFFNPQDENVSEALLAQSRFLNSDEVYVKTKQTAVSISEDITGAMCICQCSGCHCARSRRGA